MMSPLSFVQTPRRGRRAYFALKKVGKPSIASLADDKANAMAVCGALAKCWIMGGSPLREPIPVLTCVIVTVARKRGWIRSPPGTGPDT